MVPNVGFLLLRSKVKFLKFTSQKFPTIQYQHDCICSIVDSFPKVFTESLSYLPYLVFLESLRKFPGHCVAGRSLRRKVHQVGLLQLVLQCLASAGHHSPRLETDASITNQISLAERQVKPNFCLYLTQPQWSKISKGFHYFIILTIVSFAL